MRVRARRLAVGAAGVALSLVLIGCASVPLGPPPERNVALVSDSMACADPMLGTPTPGSGLVPEGFEPVAVLECVTGATREDADGVLSGTEVVRYEGDLSEFLTAMAAPSDPGTALACPAIMYGIREIWATDAAGRFVLLSFPATACGAPKEDAALAALSELAVVERAFSPGPRVELREAVAARCATRAGVAVLRRLGDGDVADERDAVDAIPWAPSPVGPIEEIVGARVCVYGADADGGIAAVLGDPGLFTDAYRLDGRAARSVLAAADAPPTDPACTVAASRFVVVQPSSGTKPGTTLPTVTVELDGCRRIVGTDVRARSAPAEILALLDRG